MLRLTVAGLLAHRLRLLLTAVTIAIGAALVAGTFILTDSVRGALSTSTATSSAEGLVTASKITLIGKNGRPITHPRAPSELLSYPTVPVLAAPYTIQSGHPPRQ